MSLSDLVTNYLACSFKPIRITASRDEWRRLEYQNPIFAVHVLCPSNTQIKSVPNVFFESHSQSSKKFMDHPLSYLSGILTNSDPPNFFLDLYGDSNAQITLDTKGLIPNRWVRMLSDFGFIQSTIDEDSVIGSDQIMKYWSDIVHSIPDQILQNMTKMCVKIMESQFIKVAVLKAPPYKLSEYQELLKNCTWLYGNRPAGTDYKQLIEQQKWGTYDALSTPSTEIFYEKCRKYHSFYDCNENPYRSLPAFEGGMILSYLHQLPWSQLRPNLVGSGNGYRDIRSHNEYYPRKDTTFEEIVVLIEVLKAEGAIYKVTIDK